MDGAVRRFVSCILTLAMTLGSAPAAWALPRATDDLVPRAAKQGPMKETLERELGAPVEPAGPAAGATPEEPAPAAPVRPEAAAPALPAAVPTVRAGLQADLQKTHVLVMAGGAAARFFPVNKIFADPTDEGRSMLQQAQDRATKTFDEAAGGSFVDVERFHVVTGADFQAEVQAQLQEVPGANILAEPSRRNTWPAILWTLAHLAAQDADATVTILTADHVIGDVPAFREAVAAAIAIAEREPTIVTIGITPSDDAREWTGFGAIKADASRTVAGTTASFIAQFIEKPSEERAGQMKEEGGWFWNSGMFVFRIRTAEEALRLYRPEMYATYRDMRQAVAAGRMEEAAQLFNRLPSKLPHPEEAGAVHAGPVSEGERKAIREEGTLLDMAIGTAFRTDLDALARMAGAEFASELLALATFADAKQRKKAEGHVEASVAPATAAAAAVRARIVQGLREANAATGALPGRDWSDQRIMVNVKSVDNSIDYAVMVPLTQQARGVVRGAVISGTFPWVDIGSWDALRKVTDADADGNVIIGEVTPMAARSSILVAEPGRSITVEGLTDVVVVHAADGTVMVTRVELAQKVKDLRDAHTGNTATPKVTQLNCEGCLVATDGPPVAVMGLTNIEVLRSGNNVTVRLRRAETPAPGAPTVFPVAPVLPIPGPGPIASAPGTLESDVAGEEAGAGVVEEAQEAEAPGAAKPVAPALAEAGRRRVTAQVAQIRFTDPRITPELQAQIRAELTRYALGEAAREDAVQRLLAMTQDLRLDLGIIDAWFTTLGTPLAMAVEAAGSAAPTGATSNLKRAQVLGSTISFDFFENISNALIEAAVAGGATEFTMNPYSTGNYIQHLLTLTTQAGGEWANRMLVVEDQAGWTALKADLGKNAPAPIAKALKAAMEPSPDVTPETERVHAQEILRSMLQEGGLVRERLQGYAADGLNGEQAYWEITQYFAGKIASRLEAIFRESRGTTGYVSIEVDPRLERQDFARPRAGGQDLQQWMIEEMRRQATELAALAPNILVKVPATEAGYATIAAVNAHYNNTLEFTDGHIRRAIEAHERRNDQEHILRLSPFISRNAVYFQEFWGDFLKEADGHVATNLNGYEAYEAMHKTGRGGYEEGAIWSSLGIKIPGDPGWLYAANYIGVGVLNTPPDTAHAVNRADFTVERKLGLKSREAIIADYFQLVKDGEIPSASASRKFSELKSGARTATEQAALAVAEWDRVSTQAVDAARLTAVEARVGELETAAVAIKPRPFTREGIAKARAQLDAGQRVTEKDLMGLVLQAEGEEKFITPFQGAIDTLEAALGKLRAAPAVRAGVAAVMGGAPAPAAAPTTGGAPAGSVPAQPVRIPERPAFLDPDVPAETLRFGTSGLRAKVIFMHDLEVYINVRGFIRYLERMGSIGLDSPDPARSTIVVGGDLRPSTPRIAAAAARAIRDAGYVVDYVGTIPTQAVAYHAMRQGNACLMVTASHNPQDENGVKFYFPDREVLKSDESGIFAAVKEIRDVEYRKTAGNTAFNSRGMLKEFTDERAYERSLGTPNKQAADLFLKRYTDAFPGRPLAGKRYAVYQHSAVGRDLLVEFLRALGADVEPVYRSEEGEFEPIDTENITQEQRDFFRQIVGEHPGIDAVLSVDGDSDRPLVMDERGEFYRGDLLNILTAKLLDLDAIATPVSVNRAVREIFGNRPYQSNVDIGSPFVIRAMEELVRRGHTRVGGWEANGGFLLQTSVQLGEGRRLEALPTRDSFLPIVAALLMAKHSARSVSQTFREEVTDLSAWETDAGLVDHFPREAAGAIVRHFSPAQNFITDWSLPRVDEVHFYGESVQAVYRYAPGTGADDDWLRGEAQMLKAEHALTRELMAIRGELETYFTTQDGFGPIESINFVSGVQIAFTNGVMAHFRGSGNADQFRFYAQARPVGNRPAQDVATALKNLGVRDPKDPATPGVEPGILLRMKQGLGGKTFVAATAPTVTVTPQDRVQLDRLVRGIIGSAFGATQLGGPRALEVGPETPMLEKQTADTALLARVKAADAAMLGAAERAGGETAAQFKTRRRVYLATDDDPALLKKDRLHLVASSGTFTAWGRAPKGSHYLKLAHPELAQAALEEAERDRYLETLARHETAVLNAGRYVESTPEEAEILNEGYRKIQDYQARVAREARIAKAESRAKRLAEKVQTTTYLANLGRLYADGRVPERVVRDIAAQLDAAKAQGDIADVRLKRYGGRLLMELTYNGPSRNPIQDRRLQDAVLRAVGGQGQGVEFSEAYGREFAGKRRSDQLRALQMTTGDFAFNERESEPIYLAAALGGHLTAFNPAFVQLFMREAVENQLRIEGLDDKSLAALLSSKQADLREEALREGPGYVFVIERASDILAGKRSRGYYISTQQAPYILALIQDQTEWAVTKVLPRPGTKLYDSDKAPLEQDPIAAIAVDQVGGSFTDAEAFSPVFIGRQQSGSPAVGEFTSAIARFAITPGGPGGAYHQGVVPVTEEEADAGTFNNDGRIQMVAYSYMSYGKGRIPETGARDQVALTNDIRVIRDDDKWVHDSLTLMGTFQPHATAPAAMKRAEEEARRLGARYHEIPAAVEIDPKTGQPVLTSAGKARVKLDPLLEASNAKAVLTMSDLKADIGGDPGHQVPPDLYDATLRASLKAAQRAGVIKGYDVQAVGDDMHLFIFHDKGADSAEIHTLAWHSFFRSGWVLKQISYPEPRGYQPYGFMQDLVDPKVAKLIKQGKLEGFANLTDAFIEALGEEIQALPAEAKFMPNIRAAYEAHKTGRAAGTVIDLPFSGNVRGQGIGFAEKAVSADEVGEWTVIASDKAGPGAYNYRVYWAMRTALLIAEYADPLLDQARRGLALREIAAKLGDEILARAPGIEGGVAREFVDRLISEVGKTLSADDVERLSRTLKHGVVYELWDVRPNTRAFLDAAADDPSALTLLSAVNQHNIKRMWMKKRQGWITDLSPEEVAAIERRADEALPTLRAELEARRQQVATELSQGKTRDQLTPWEQGLASQSVDELIPVARQKHVELLKMREFLADDYFLSASTEKLAVSGGGLYLGKDDPTAWVLKAFAKLYQAITKTGVVVTLGDARGSHWVAIRPEGRTTSVTVKWSNPIETSMTFTIGRDGTLDVAERGLVVSADEYADPSYDAARGRVVRFNERWITVQGGFTPHGPNVEDVEAAYPYAETVRKLTAADSPFAHPVSDTDAQTLAQVALAATFRQIGYAPENAAEVARMVADREHPSQILLEEEVFRSPDAAVALARLFEWMRQVSGARSVDEAVEQSGLRFAVHVRPEAPEERSLGVDADMLAAVRVSRLVEAVNRGLGDAARLSANWFDAVTETPAERQSAVAAQMPVLSEREAEAQERERQRREMRELDELRGGALARVREAEADQVAPAVAVQRQDVRMSSREWEQAAKAHEAATTALMRARLDRDRAVRERLEAEEERRALQSASRVVAVVGTREWLEQVAPERGPSALTDLVRVRLDAPARPGQAISAAAAIHAAIGAAAAPNRQLPEPAAQELDVQFEAGVIVPKFAIVDGEEIQEVLDDYEASIGKV